MTKLPVGTGCHHRYLRFIDGGSRILCEDEVAPDQKCNRTWVIEARPPGSWMADVGAPSNVNVMPPLDKRTPP